MPITVSKSLTFTDDIVTYPISILAKRDAGKTYAAKVFAEELLTAGKRVVVIDPIGNWYGLRLKAGNSPSGLDVIVMGGDNPDHRDVPLEHTSGKVIADFVVDTERSCVLDVSHFSKGEQVRFVTDFASHLYQRNRRPIMVILEEADMFAPQRPFREEARCLRAVQVLSKQGRNRGIGVMALSQRAASLNKDVLTQTEVLIVLKTMSPQDRKAIGLWIEAWGEKAQEARLMGDLASLARGTGYVWSPPLNLFHKVTFRKLHTLDTSRTPDDETPRDLVVTLAPVDLGKLEAQIKATIEKAKQDDPKELRKQLAEAKNQLAVRAVLLPLPPGRVEVLKTREVQVLTDADRALLMRLADSLRALHTGDVPVDLNAVFTAIQKAIDGAVVQRQKAVLAVIEGKRFEELLRKIPLVEVPLRVSAHQQRADAAEGVRAAAKSVADRVKQPRHDTAEGLDGAQQKILDTLAMLVHRGLVANRDMLARWIGIHPKGGRFNQNLAKLRAEGYLEGLQLTAQARAVAGMAGTGFAGANAPLDATQQEIVSMLAAAGNGYTREELAAALGIHPKGGRFNQNLGRLRTMGLIPPRGTIELTEAAFK